MFQRQTSKKKVATILVLLVFFSVCFVALNGHYWRRYDTLEDAICAGERGVQKDDIIETLKSGHMAIGIYKTKDGAINSTNFAFDERGWYPIRDENIFTSKKIRKGQWQIWSNSYKGEYYVWIFLYTTDLNISPPEDTLQSQFQYYYHNSNNILFYKWFLVLDEKPENYSVIIDGDTIKLT